MTVVLSQRKGTAMHTVDQEEIVASALHTSRMWVLGGAGVLFLLKYCTVICCCPFFSSYTGLSKTVLGKKDRKRGSQFEYANLFLLKRFYGRAL